MYICMYCLYYHYYQLHYYYHVYLYSRAPAAQNIAVIVLIHTNVEHTIIII